MADGRAWGLPDDVLAQLEAGPAVPADELWPEHVPVFEAFCAVTTQWRLAQLANGQPRYLGLDYAGVQAGLAMAGKALTPAQFADLRIMEREAMTTLNGGS